MYRFIMSKRYVKLLFAIDEKEGKNISKLGRESGMTLSHLSIVMDQWLREGLIIKKEKGKERNIMFTERGKKMLSIIREYDKLFREQFNEDNKLGDNENGGKKGRA